MEGDGKSRRLAFQKTNLISSYFEQKKKCANFWQKLYIFPRLQYKMYYNIVKKYIYTNISCEKILKMIITTIYKSNIKDNHCTLQKVKEYQIVLQVPPAMKVVLQT